MKEDIKNNIKLNDAKVFDELVAALKSIFNDERIDKNVRDEYSKRLMHHL